MKKTALITGASYGVGDAVARHFAANGWNVVATMSEAAEKTELDTLRNVQVSRIDFHDPDSIEQAVEGGIRRFGKIDALINNLGFDLFDLVETTQKKRIQEQFDQHLLGVLEVIVAILPHFRANQGGMIINVGPGAGVFELPMLSLYFASKFALEGLSEALSNELSAENIIVKLVETGGVINTGFGKLGIEQDAHYVSLADFDSYIPNAMAIFADSRESKVASEDDVASLIFTAATDGTDQFRYVSTEDMASTRSELLTKAKHPRLW